MFGLKTPIAQSEKTDEFDSVTTILSQSSVARPSRSKQAPPWMSSIGDDGGIFHLELPPGAEVSLVKQCSVDGNSVSSFAIGAGCNSEDTGYASDQDPWGTDHQRSSNGKRNKQKGNDLRLKSNDKSLSDNGSFYDKVSLGNKTVSSYNSYNDTDIFHDRESIKRYTFDQRYGSNGHHRKNVTGSNHPMTFLDKDEEIDDGIFLKKSELRSSTGSSVSYSSKRSDSSVFTDKSSRNTSQSAHLKNSLLLNRFQKFQEWKSVHVDLPLNSKSAKSAGNGVYLNASLCETILGIIPGKSDCLDGSTKTYGHQIFVKALTPEGPAFSRPEITTGSWLYSVNGQEITWDNMKSVLSSVTKLKKVKLTLKCLRSDKSTLDLEGLVSVLTSDPLDSVALNNVSALYISMEGVDPDNPDLTNNDGVVYSYSQGKQALLGLQGLFYTLAHVIKDINRASTIKNSTIEVEDQPVHIAYLQEGSDILVFAMPASCVSLSDLNTLLSEFSRLLWILYGTIQTAFSKEENSFFIDNILTYLFRQAVSTSSGQSVSSSSLASSFSLSFSSSSALKEKSVSSSELNPFIRYSKHIQYIPLPSDHQMVIDRTLNEFESSDFHDMSESFYGCRRQYTILGSAYFYCGQLVTSHLAPADLHDLHLYLQHLGVLDLMGRCSVSQFVAWREVFPTRFCHEVSEINNSFGYSEPIARWCYLVIGLSHGLFCCLLETVGSRSFKKSTLSPDVFYVDQAKACLLRIQSPSLMAALNLRVNKEVQSAFTKSDYCATYVNTTGGKNTRLFSNEGGQIKSHHSPFVAALGSDWTKRVDDIESSNGSVSSFDIYKSTHNGKMYPIQCDSFDIPFNISLSDVAPLQRLSTTKHPSLYQYCCIDGMEGTICLGTDMESSGIFHSHILQGFYKCCRQIHQVFSESESAQNSSSFFVEDEDEDSNMYDSLTADLNFRGMKEHGILMTFTPHQGMETTNKECSVLEYWVVGRKLKRPYKKILFACFHVSSSENMIELAFRHSFGS